MKALKSDLARVVLADPKAKGQLRQFLVVRDAKTGRIIDTSRKPIEVTTAAGKILVRPVVVPKAA